jgi:threonine/homoserine/homoserine lactone efflux protein
VLQCAIGRASGGPQREETPSMFDTATLASFVAVVMGLFLIPGPAVFLVLTRTAQGGRRVGVATGLGIAAGDLVHTAFAAFGLSALLMTSALAFNVVKLAGAAYLVWLGIRALRTRPAPADADADADADAASTGTPGAAPSALRAFLQAIPAELLNPKAALFFLAFMPQFVRPEHGSTFAQFAVLGLIFVVLSAAYSSLLAVAAVPIGRFAKRLRWLARWRHQVVGSIFLGLGVKVAIQQQR